MEVGREGIMSCRAPGMDLTGAPEGMIKGQTYRRTEKLGAGGLSSLVEEPHRPTCSARLHSIELGVRLIAYTRRRVHYMGIKKERFVVYSWTRRTG